MRGWYWPTEWGTFSIVVLKNGRFAVIFEEEDLGSYHSPEAALEDLIGNHCFSNSSGFDTSEVGLPDSLNDWHTLR